VLLRQLPGRHVAREGRGRLPAPLRLRDGDAALPRLPQQADLPVDYLASGGVVPLEDHLQVRRPALRLRLLVFAALGAWAAPAPAQLGRDELVRLDRGRVLAAAQRSLRAPPVTVPAFPAARSAGGRPDFYPH